MVPQHWGTCSSASCAEPLLLLSTWRQEGGRKVKQVEARADMLGCVSLLPWSLLTSAFQGERAKLQSAPAQCVPSTRTYLRHWGAVKEDIVKRPQVTEHNRLLAQWEYPFGACRNNVWLFFKEGHAQKLLRFKTEVSLFKILLYLWFVGHSCAFR